MHRDAERDAQGRSSRLRRRFPALKALMARHTGDAAWNNMRPPHLKLTAEQQAKLFAAFDACGVQLAKAA